MHCNFHIHFFRNFPHKKEQNKHLEEYQEWLEEEAKCVNEALQEIKN
jgi:hypothetical protein